jgi:hypothetical protein
MVSKSSYVRIVLQAACLGYASLLLPGTDDLSCSGPCDDALCAPEKWEASAKPEESTIVVLYGRVVKAETLGDGDCYADVTFRTQKVWKGPRTPLVTLRTGKPCAKLWPFAIGHMYLVAAVPPHLPGWPPEIDLCRFPPIDEKGAPPLIYKLGQQAVEPGKDIVTP